MTSSSVITLPSHCNAILLFSDGTYFFGKGIGAKAITTGEICFNTAMTGYQEVLTDPSYAGQIITFTFPHIGNVGTNNEDIEADQPHAKGLIVREDITEPANFRHHTHLNDWLIKHNITGIANVDTRALTRFIRTKGAQNVLICHTEAGATLDSAALKATLAATPSLHGLELAGTVSCDSSYGWNQAEWALETGYSTVEQPHCKVVAIDYGAKQNILRCLVSSGCEVVVVPANASYAEIMQHNPDGIFLSNGPGDPAATGTYAVAVIQQLLAANLPLFGICLGHQLLALALGGSTQKMHQGHRGANHPVQDLATGKVEITSQNHGFAVMKESLPDHVRVSHISLFDGTVEGLEVVNRPVFSVQYHPESSPGPHDSHHLFDKFVGYIKEASQAKVSAVSVRGA